MRTVERLPHNQIRFLEDGQLAGELGPNQIESSRLGDYILAWIGWGRLPLAASDFRADRRYDFVTCATCGQRFQRIDFRSYLHTSTCAKPAEPAL